MKTFLLSAIVFLFFLAGTKAQPVFQASDLNPVSGDKFIHVDAKIAGVAVPKEGKNLTWDYSKLKDSTSVPDTFRYMKKTKTPFGNVFPQSNLAGTSSESTGDYSYYKTTDNYLESFGSVTVGDTISWNPPYRLAIYPATYGTHFTDTSTVISKSAGSTFTQGFRDSVKAVGYGTLKLPHNKTYTNVLMVRTTTIFSYVVLGHHFVGTTHSINFFAAGYHNPLASFSLNQNNQLTFVTYGKNAVTSFSNDVIDEENSIASNGSNTSIKLYPNPATSAFTINFNNAATKKPSAIFINDINGQRVYSQQSNISSGQRINCATFKEGIYLVRIEMNDGSTEIQKLEIRK